MGYLLEYKLRIFKKLVDSTKNSFGCNAIGLELQI